MIRISKRWMIVIPVLFQLLAGAQNFNWSSSLDTVPATGFYTIPLSIDWLVRVKTDLSDVRIRDEKNNTVPYLIKKNPSENRSSFVSFPILKQATDTIFTTVDIDASGHHGTDHICLVIANNAVERFTSVSGSDDGKQWFIINEKLPLTNKSEYTTDHFVQLLNLPFIRYKYLRLVINNQGTDPLQILDAGIYADTTIREFLSLYPHRGTTWSQRDSSDGNTYVFIHNPQPYPVDRISLAVDGPKFYSREVKAYTVAPDGTKKYLGFTTLRPGTNPAIWVMAGKSTDLLLVIENGDNPFLKLTAANTQCRIQQIVAWLEKGKQYNLLGGNDSLSAANYDLALFRDSIPAQAPELNHGTITSNNNVVNVSKTNPGWWIWPAIIIALVVLALLVYRLIGDMKKKEV